MSHGVRLPTWLRRTPGTMAGRAAVRTQARISGHPDPEQLGGNSSRPLLTSALQDPRALSATPTEGSGNLGKAQVGGSRSQGALALGTSHHPGAEQVSGSLGELAGAPQGGIRKTSVLSTDLQCGPVDDDGKKSGLVTPQGLQAALSQPTLPVSNAVVE